MGEKGFHEAMARQLANQIRRLVEESIVSMVRLDINCFRKEIINFSSLKYEYKSRILQDSLFNL